MSDRSFRWGVGTSAYQIEGAWNEDGRGRSIWDDFLHDRALPDGDVAADHYHRLEEDLDLLADLGVSAYRFSISWARVIPDGDGALNEPGARFYDRLVDGLMARGIEPWPTLYHWDLPSALDTRGGWTSRASVGWFEQYAARMAERYGDRVEHWITINEPWVAAFLGYQEGVFAPGHTSWSKALTAGHHLLLAHAGATRAIRRIVPDAQVGLALDCRPAEPLTDRDADVAATLHFDGFRNRWFFDPVFLGSYPEDMVEAYSADGRLPEGLIVDGDLEAISTPLDFCGINYYTTLTIDESLYETDHAEGKVGADPDEGFTEMGWRIDPDGLHRFLVRVAEEWSPPALVVTENGASFSDGPGPDGHVHDTRRIDYLERHIEAVERAIADGAPVDGYFVWSFLDNLEWTNGYDQRFGLVHVDFSSGARTIKDSGFWYRDLIASREARHTD